MKKFASVIAALALVAGFSTFALAAPGMGPGYGPGYGWTQLTPEQQAQAEKARADFLNETQALRQKLATKRVELNTLRAQANPDPAKLKAVADELVDLGAQLAKKRNEFMAKYPYAFGPGFGRGYGRGFGGGFCGGPGYGMGLGGGMGIGSGPMMGPGGTY